MPRLAALALALSATTSTFAATAATDAKPYSAATVLGLDPALADRYEPINGSFQCLDNSGSIPVSAVNDDYCDCADGSDEPGTSACEGVGDGWFHCKNEGHLPGKVRRSRVNDGLCDPECCDGSDEWATGLCADTCFEIGKSHRQAVEAELKTRRTGAKIRGTYVKWAVGEKKRLEAELAQKRSELKGKEAEAEQTRVQLERTEAQSKDELEQRKQTPLFTHLLSQKLALTRLRSRTARIQSELDTLHNILEELRKDYNPNYQDMAAKAAVVGYEEFLKSDDPPTDTQTPEDEISDRELDDIDRKDLDGLLLSESLPDDDAEDSMLYRIDEYIPDVLYDQWETVRDLAIDWMMKIGFLGRGSRAAGKGPDGPHVAAARERHTKANAELTRVRSDITKAEDGLRQMQDRFGPDAEWKKLDGTCIDHDAGEYTYELCFFGKATQKHNRDGSSNHLGTFVEWKTSEAAGTFDYYTRQHYRNGARCWNGPMRSATVDLTCGTVNAILSISEPEKCEYHIKATSPALCWPLDCDTAAKEEL